MFNNAQGGTNMAKAVLRLPTVKFRTGLSRSTIYLRVSQGSFPRPINLGSRAVGWLEGDVEAWLDLQINRSQKKSEGF
jgi:prophage regulatory protein